MRVRVPLLIGAAFCSHFLTPSSASGQGTAFTYQGRLNESDNPANGFYDMRVALFLNSTGGGSVAGPITNLAVAVSNGLFATTLDFGGVFDGTTYWLQISVRTNGGNNFTLLSPRQQLTPNPYAMFAEAANAAGLSGTIPSANLGGGYASLLIFTNPGNVFVGDGSGLSGVNAAELGGLPAGQFWQLNGNSGTAAGSNFIGTLDSQALELHVRGMRGLRLEPKANDVNRSNVLNVVGGSPVNFVASGVVGATIAGGGAQYFQGSFQTSNTVTGSFGTVGGGQGNGSGALNATVGGGYNNTASGPGSFVGGGGYDGSFVLGNTASGGAAAVGGGLANLASGSDAAVAGGDSNVASGDYSVVAGGAANSASGTASAVAGGFANVAGGDYSFAAGEYAQANRVNSFVWGDGSINPFKGAATGSGFSVLASGGLYFYNGINGVNLDCLNQNTGNIDYSLRFGSGSGEGIGSKRNVGGNQYALDFYTSFTERMTIANNGYVGIGTTSPSQQLEVNGEYIMVDGYGGVQCYIGDDGIANDVQIGSLKSGITSVICYNAADNAYMHLHCSSITIEGGADLAEPFPISSQGEDVPQGSVVVIDEQHAGQLKMSRRPYDTRVAGVVSGANGIKPGIQMQQQGLLEGGKNVALTGRVYVQADATNAAIQPGDLLTTSSLPGHAMKVTDHNKAQGAILGKAMSALDRGQGMVLVLVTLQ